MSHAFSSFAITVYVMSRHVPVLSVRSVAASDDRVRTVEYEALSVRRVHDGVPYAAPVLPLRTEARIHLHEVVVVCI